MEVTATGPRTELGIIGKALEQTKPEPTMLQTETRRVVRVLAISGLVAGHGGGDIGAHPRWWWATSRTCFLGIAMAMAILPEEFVVLTDSRARCVAALAQPGADATDVGGRDVGRRHRLGVETGTLTQNQTTLTESLPQRAGPPTW